jgi:mRNA interferase HicA
MKREGLLRHLRRHGCVLRREGKEHTLWENPQTGHAEAVPRHAEIANLLAKRICRRLSSRTRRVKLAMVQKWAK